jgi:hypothetical protein
MPLEKFYPFISSITLKDPIEHKITDNQFLMTKQNMHIRINEPVEQHNSIKPRSDLGINSTYENPQNAGIF